MKNSIMTLLFLSACTSSSGTYLLVKITDQNADVIRTLDVYFPYSESGDGGATPISVSDTPSISFPTSLALHIERMLVSPTAICVDGLDADGKFVRSGRVPSVSIDMGTVSVDLMSATPCSMLTTTGTKNKLTVMTTEGDLTTGFTVTSDQGGISCPINCMADFDPTTMVTLTARTNIDPSTNMPTNAGAYFNGWTGDCAGLLPTCTLTMDKAHSVTANFVAMNYVFVTEAAFSDLSKGSTAADQFCQDAADNAAPNKLPGVYRAWISTNTTAAKDHLGAARGWMRPDGNPVLDSAIDPTKIFYPPKLDQNGHDQSGVIVATGTDGGGNLVINTNCNDFSSNTSAQDVITGKPSGGSGAWTHLSVASCNTTNLHLYCFGIGSSNTLTVSKTPGRTAFVLRGSWNPSSMGVATADTACRSEATNNNLSGTYFALVATEASSAIDRPPFSTTADSLPWVRPDGIPLVTKASDMKAGMGFLAAFDQASNGIYLDENARVWTGGDGTNAAAMANGVENCLDWTSQMASDSAMVGTPWDSSGNDFFQDMAVPCNTTGIHLYCLQQ